MPAEVDGMTQIANNIALTTDVGLVRTAENGDQMRPFEELFMIKGPMGRGLEIKPSGVHVAFCGGTGVLVFLDLVSHLLMRNIFSSKLPADRVDPQFKYLKDNFEFHLYVSFADQDQTIGLELCEALERVNVKLHLTNFRFKVRMSESIFF